MILLLYAVVIQHMEKAGVHVNTWNLGVALALAGLGGLVVS
jgi:hypothetical protein